VWLHAPRGAGRADHRGGGADRRHARHGHHDQRQRIAADAHARHLERRERLLRSYPDPGARAYTCSQGDTQLWCEETVATTPNPVFRRVEIAVYPDASKSVRLAWLVTLLPNDARNVF
jgi:general secretion pathway protein I